MKITIQEIKRIDMLLELQGILPKYIDMAYSGANITEVLLQGFCGGLDEVDLCDVKDKETIRALEFCRGKDSVELLSSLYEKLLDVENVEVLKSGEKDILLGYMFNHKIGIKSLARLSSSQNTAGNLSNFLNAATFTKTFSTSKLGLSVRWIRKNFLENGNKLSDEHLLKLENTLSKKSPAPKKQKQNSNGLFHVKIYGSFNGYMAKTKEGFYVCSKEKYFYPTKEEAVEALNYTLFNDIAYAELNG